MARKTAMPGNFLAPTNRNRFNVPAHITILREPAGKVWNLIYHAANNEAKKLGVSDYNWDMWVNSTNVRGIRSIRVRVWPLHPYNSELPTHDPSLSVKITDAVQRAITEKYGIGVAHQYSYRSSMEMPAEVCIKVWYYSKSKAGKALAG